MMYMLHYLTYPTQHTAGKAVAQTKLTRIVVAPRIQSAPTNYCR